MGKELHKIENNIYIGGKESIYGLKKVCTGEKKYK